MGIISFIISFVGFCGFLRFAFYVYKIIYSYKSKPKNLKEKNIRWAMITGASSGVGYELALKLCNQGINVVALGRNEERLNQLEDQVKNKGAQFIKIVADFSDKEEASKVFEKVGGNTIDALFICHGSSTIKPLEEFTNEEIEQYNNSFITSNVILTKYFIKQKGKTMTVMSSANSFWTTPYATQYGAVKRWLNSFCHTIRFEANISIQIINAGFIKDTLFFKNVSPGLKAFSTPPPYALTPGRVADIILSTIGTGFDVDIGVDSIVSRCLLWIVPPPIVDLVFKGVGSQISKGLKIKSE